MQGCRNFEHVVPVGDNGVPAMRLAAAGICTTSFPFDLAASSLGDVAHFVSVGAEAWFAEDGDASPGSGHKMHWPHHEGDDAREHVTRCWHRLTDAMTRSARDGRRVLLLHHAQSDAGCDGEGMMTVINAFHERWPDLSFDVLSCCEHVLGPSDETEEGAHVYEFHFVFAEINMMMARFGVRERSTTDDGGCAVGSHQDTWSGLFERLGLKPDVHPSEKGPLTVDDDEEGNTFETRKTP